MDKETYEALKNVIKIARKNALEINKRRKSKDKVWEQATLYRDIVQVESWIDEVAKEYIDEA